MILQELDQIAFAKKGYFGAKQARSIYNYLL